MDELGNTVHAIPYFGLFQPGKDPIHFDGVYLSPEAILKKLKINDAVQEQTDAKVLPAQDRAEAEPQHISKLAP